MNFTYRYYMTGRGMPVERTYAPFYDYSKYKVERVPLYLPKKPYEYVVDYDTTPGVTSTGARYFRRRIKYLSVENPDYIPHRRRYPFEGYHKFSDEARITNRSRFWNRFHDNESKRHVATQLHRTANAKKVASFVGKWWKRYKDRKLGEALDRGLELSRRRANVEVIDLTGDEPRVYKRHRPLNR